jgi:hypothetical protein
VLFLTLVSLYLDEFEGGLLLATLPSNDFMSFIFVYLLLLPV